MTRLAVEAFGPARPWVRPGAEIVVSARLVSDRARRAQLSVGLLDLDRQLTLAMQAVRLPAGRSIRQVRVRLPHASRHGYGLQLRLTAADGARAEAGSAVEALEDWWEAPRHVALTTFRDAGDALQQVAAAARWHVTVAQAYDWMHRHYRYLAPEEPFRDALGREVSHRAVRALVRGGHRSGIATLAYGSVYGAEPEYVARHPNERVFDAAGEPLSLGGMFFINDLRPGGPWRARLLREYERACRRLGFDGIHMDTYGPPHEAVAADGEPIRFAELYPGLIAEAAARLGQLGADRRVLFNCVEGFPLDAVADAPAAALYLELWPPDERYADLVRWIDRARAAGNGRAVVIAAYVAALRDAAGDPARRRRAIESAALLTAVVSAAGAFHHVLADGDRLLVEGYYPAAVPLRPAEVRELRAAWVFGARYLHVLSDPAAVGDDPRHIELLDAQGQPIPVAVAGAPTAGAVWVRATATPTGRVLSLVDLRDQDDDRWVAERTPVTDVAGWTVRWPGSTAPVAASPWADGGGAKTLRPAVSSEGAGHWALPRFRRWLLVVDPRPVE